MKIKFDKFRILKRENETKYWCGIADISAEHRKIVYTHLNGREELIPKIERELKEVNQSFILGKVMENNPQVLYQLINKDKTHYIWEFGRNARICFNILEKLDIKVIGIIDRDAKGSKYNNIPVCSSRSEMVWELLSVPESRVFISSRIMRRKLERNLMRKGLVRIKS